MSMDSCRKCGAQVDTDFDLEFYFETGGSMPDQLCERCRDQLREPVEPQKEQVTHASSS